jgi:hypothetical protein
MKYKPKVVSYGSVRSDSHGGVGRHAYRSLPGTGGGQETQHRHADD